MDAVVTVCSWNTNVIMFWAWMFLSPDAVGYKWTEHVLKSADYMWSEGSTSRLSSFKSDCS